MDLEEERAYAAALAEVTAPGAVPLEEITDRRVEPMSSSATPAETDPVKMELDSPALAVIEVEGAAPKRTLRFADEEAAEVKSGNRARFASPSPGPSAEAGPSRRARFASPDVEAEPPKRARFASPPPAPVLNAEPDTPTPIPVRVATPPPVKTESATKGEGERPPTSPPPPTTDDTDQNTQRQRARFE